MTATQDRIAKALETKRANKVAREALRENLEGGATIYPDTPPGVGWVLLHPSGHKSYMASRELVVDLWVTKYRPMQEADTQEALAA